MPGGAKAALTTTAPVAVGAAAEDPASAQHAAPPGVVPPAGKGFLASWHAGPTAGGHWAASSAA
eukprot:3485883-Pyramimonas_sp.AAC.1